MTASNALNGTDTATGLESPPVTRRTTRRALRIALAVAGAGLVLDQGTKAIAATQLQQGERVPLVGDLLSLSLLYNPGAAFSLGSGSTWIFTIVGVLAAAATIVFAALLRGVRWGIVLGLVLGGVVGNLVDRLVNPPSFGQGHVTDFIAYGDLVVGNVADVLVVAGVALLILRLLTSDPREQRASGGAARGSLVAQSERAR
ncbi:signal peptidase II [Timonella senegalensis]|uniref:signal peptidase II n=1 Tax=Timonella senegalensis TaxID=1465825 RepID=UPI002FE25396